MSGILDFLFEGKPPASVTSYGTASQNMPQWLSDYTQGLISRANAVAAEPYQQYGGPRLADFSPQQNQSFGMVNDLVGQQNGTLGSALGTTTGVSTGPLGAAAAAPYMSGAGQKFTGQNVTDYMSPYIQNVTDRNAQLAGRAFNEQFLPGLERTFGSSGADARSSAYRSAADRGTRDIMEGLSSQNLAALNQGYGEAGTLFNQDASRMGSLAQLAGNQATSDAGTRLNASGQMGTLAQLQKQLGLTDVGALQQVGGIQQGANQQSLDLAYQDFQKQRDYPKDQLAFMQSMIQGIPYNQNVTSTNVGPANAVGPSTVQQLGSAATGIAGLIGALGKANAGGGSHGGRAARLRYGGRRFARGGAVRGTLRRL